MRTHSILLSSSIVQSCTLSWGRQTSINWSQLSSVFDYLTCYIRFLCHNEKGAVYLDDDRWQAAAYTERMASVIDKFCNELEWNWGMQKQNEHSSSSAFISPFLITWVLGRYPSITQTVHDSFVGRRWQMVDCFSSWIRDNVHATPMSEHYNMPINSVSDPSRGTGHYIG